MHEYRKRLNAALLKGVIDKESVAHVSVFHDDWCGIYSWGECNCDPDILIRTDKGIVEVMTEHWRCARNPSFSKIAKINTQGH